MNVRYVQAASHLKLPRVQFGYGGITFFPLEELDEEQRGYEGSDWKEGWLVIAREDTCGDPIFVDSAAEEMPVFTAMHGEGTWDAKPVAPSLGKFSAALSFVLPFCAGREHPVGLERNPLSSIEQSALVRGLAGIIGNPLPSFWQVLFASAP
jgi:hypothetical protein